MAECSDGQVKSPACASPVGLSGGSSSQGLAGEAGRYSGEKTFFCSPAQLHYRSSLHLIIRKTEVHVV